MIQANELRIGNYVYWSNPNKKGILHIVKGILEYTLHTVPISICEFKDYEPIPLTEEILVKLGAKKIIGWDDSVIYRVENELNNIDIELCEEGFETDLSTKIFFVHQYQNYIFSTIGKELTLNTI